MLPLRPLFSSLSLWVPAWCPSSHNLSVSNHLFCSSASYSISISTAEASSCSSPPSLNPADTVSAWPRCSFQQYSIVLGRGHDVDDSSLLRLNETSDWAGMRSLCLGYRTPYHILSAIWAAGSSLRSFVLGWNERWFSYFRKSRWTSNSTSLLSFIISRTSLCKSSLFGPTEVSFLILASAQLTRWSDRDQTGHMLNDLLWSLLQVPYAYR